MSLGSKTLFITGASRGIGLAIALRAARMDPVLGESRVKNLLAMDPGEFARQMAYWAAFFDTSGDLPIAGCRATGRRRRTCRA